MTESHHPSSHPFPSQAHGHRAIPATKTQQSGSNQNSLSIRQEEQGGRGRGRGPYAYAWGRLAEGGCTGHTSVVQYLTDLWPLDTQYTEGKGQMEGLFHNKTVMGVQCVMFSGLKGHRWAMIRKISIGCVKKTKQKQNNIPNCYAAYRVHHGVTCRYQNKIINKTGLITINAQKFVFLQQHVLIC